MKPNNTNTSTVGEEYQTIDVNVVGNGKEQDTVENAETAETTNQPKQSMETNTQEPPKLDIHIHKTSSKNSSEIGEQAAIEIVGTKDVTATHHTSEKSLETTQASTGEASTQQTNVSDPKDKDHAGATVVKDGLQNNDKNLSQNEMPDPLGIAKLMEIDYETFRSTTKLKELASSLVDFNISADSLMKNIARLLAFYQLFETIYDTFLGAQLLAETQDEIVHQLACGTVAMGILSFIGLISPYWISLSHLQSFVHRILIWVKNRGSKSHVNFRLDAWELLIFSDPSILFASFGTLGTDLTDILLVSTLLVPMMDMQTGMRECVPISTSKYVSVAYMALNPGLTWLQAVIGHFRDPKKLSNKTLFVRAVIQIVFGGLVAIPIIFTVTMRRWIEKPNLFVLLLPMPVYVLMQIVHKQARLGTWNIFCPQHCKCRFVPDIVRIFFIRITCFPARFLLVTVSTIIIAIHHESVFVSTNIAMGVGACHLPEALAAYAMYLGFPLIFMTFYMCAGGNLLTSKGEFDTTAPVLSESTTFTTNANVLIQQHSSRKLLSNQGISTKERTTPSLASHTVAVA